MTQARQHHELDSTIPSQAGLERGWNVLRRPRTARCPTSISCDVAIVGSGAGARHHGRTAQRRRPVGGDRRGRPAAQQPRLQPARVRGLPGAVPGQRQPARPPTRPSTSCRAAASAARPRSTGRARSARPATRSAYWREHFELPGLTDDAMSPLVPAGRAAAEHRPLAGAAQRQQRHAAPGRGTARHFGRVRSCATSRAAGTSAPAAWAARPTPSSRCW